MSLAKFSKNTPLASVKRLRRQTDTNGWWLFLQNVHMSHFCLDILRQPLWPTHCFVV